jgi:hypothetical protein
MPAQPITIHVAGDLHITVGPDAADITTPILAALAKTQGEIMTDVDAAVAAVTAQFDTFKADLERELTDFGNLVAGHLTTEQQAALDALSAKFTTAQAEVDAADPVPAAPAV